LKKSKRQSEEAKSAKGYDRLAKKHPKYKATLHRMARDERRHAKNLKRMRL